jgi:phytoene dehydrogenase-like protein
MLSSSAGVYTFHHDPGELSAAFVWNHSVRVLLKPPPAARYPIGGWGVLVDILHRHAGQLGVEIELSSTVSVVPEPPVIIATELGQAGALLGEELAWPSGNTVCLDLAVRADRGDPFVVADLDEAGWMERFTASDPTLAPDGEQLIQAQMPIRPAESVEQASARLERLLDSSLSAWRERVTWRRRQIMDGRSGALDMPGTNWRERPSIDRGDGVFLAGDMVAAPGLLSEVSWASATQAAALALQAATIKAPRLRQVA